MEVSRLEVWFSLNWIENGNKHVAFRINSVNCITNSLCAVYQISPRNTLYRWWLKYEGLKKNYYYLQGYLLKRVTNCMKFRSRKMLKSLQHKNIKNFIVSNLTVKKHWYRQPLMQWYSIWHSFPFTVLTIKTVRNFPGQRAVRNTFKKLTERSAVDYT